MDGQANWNRDAQSVFSRQAVTYLIPLTQGWVSGQVASALRFVDNELAIGVKDASLQFAVVWVDRQSVFARQTKLAGTFAGGQRTPRATLDQ
jgi:hypothetical protein